MSYLLGGSTTIPSCFYYRDVKNRNIVPAETLSYEDDLQQFWLPQHYQVWHNHGISYLGTNWLGKGELLVEKVDGTKEMCGRERRSRMIREHYHYGQAISWLSAFVELIKKLAISRGDRGTAPPIGSEYNGGPYLSSYPPSHLPA